MKKMCVILVIDTITIKTEDCMETSSISTESTLSSDDIEDPHPCSHNSLGIVSCERR